MVPILIWASWYAGNGKKRVTKNMLIVMLSVILTKVILLSFTASAAGREFHLLDIVNGFLFMVKTLGFKVLFTTLLSNPIALGFCNHATILLCGRNSANPLSDNRDAHGEKMAQKQGGPVQHGSCYLII